MPKSFAASLLFWYDQHKRDLPWRRTKDPYRIWISEMMLQQTTVNAVIPYFERWFDLFPTIAHLAKADVQQVLKAWQGLGYYARARNLHKTANILHAQHKGVMPKDPAVVRQLPGFGPYSTGSVLSIAFDLPLTIIDANVRRVVMRLLCIEANADAKQDDRINDFLLSIFPKMRAGDFNQSLMELGALVCRSKEPLCNICPVRVFCKAYAQGKQEIIPIPKVKAIKEIHAVIAIIQKGNSYFIQQRPSKGLLADLWEFPGGKVEAGESRPKALERELKEELGVGVKQSKHLFDVTHFYTQFKVKLSVYAVDLDHYPTLTNRRKWVNSKTIHNYPMPSGSAKIIDKLVPGTKF